MNDESTTTRQVPLRADLSALFVVLSTTTLFVSFRFYYDNWLADFDILTYFLPAFGYLGDRLRDGDVPAWNPYFSGGQSQAGDPGAGWMFLPAMIGFTLFDAVNGFKAMVLIELLTAGSATYLFCRRIGLVPIAAMIGGLALATGPLMYGSTSFVTIIGQITPFLALAMFGTESALRADRLSARLAWSSVAGVAVIQTFLSWPQGFMYTVMYVGAWMLYRWLFAAAPGVTTRREMLERVLVSGVSMTVSAVTFGAAGILPRLDFSRQSNIPGGDYSKVIGADYAAAVWPIEQVVGLFLQNTADWRPILINSAVLVLAILGAIIGRNRFGTPVFVVATLLFIDLSIQHSLTRWAFYLIPGFEHMHSHRPTAGVSMVFFPVAILAATAVQLLIENRRERFDLVKRIIPLTILSLTMLRVGVAGWPTSWLQLGFAVIATILILIPLLPVRMRPPNPVRFAIPGLIAAMLVFPNAMDIVGTVRDPQTMPEMEDSFGRDDEVQEIIGSSMAKTTPDSAASFLQQQLVDGQPFRYAPYFGTGSPDTPYSPSSNYRMRPWAVAALMNAKAPRLGLETIGGYNPIHLRYYTEYLTALNGTQQDYHWLDLYLAGIEQSPLLDMLNVQFVIVPVHLDKPVPIAAWGNEVYRDDLVVIYENPNVYDRAWIVHEVQPAMDGAELELFKDGSVNGREVAYVAGDLPAVAPNSGVETVTVTETTHESMSIATSSSADGLLVVSDAYADGWNAYVDGKRTDVLRTNHAFRGVALPAGEHEVLFRYEPRSLTIGMWTTGIATLALIGTWSWAGVESRRRRRA